MYCTNCKQELPLDRFSKGSQRRYYRGKIKQSRCSKCGRRAKKTAIATTERKLTKDLSPKKRARLERRLARMIYSVIVKPKLNSAKRRTQRLNARPKWVKDSWFEPIYDLCAKVSKETGVKHHVDHIVPLQGKRVSGLDVPWNLQVLTAKENCSKSNKF